MLINNFPHQFDAKALEKLYTQRNMSSIPPNFLRQASSKHAIYTQSWENINQWLKLLTKSPHYLSILP